MLQTSTELGLRRRTNLAISQKTRKILWARSGNRCAFPGCSEALVIARGADGDGEAVIGEEAHIVAQSAGGPRAFEAVPEKNVDGPANLILLCPTHHRIIDEQPGTYSVQTLRDIKEAHERRVRESDEEPVRVARRIAPAAAIGACDGMEMFRAWQIGATLLVVCMFGSEPVLMSTNRWRGSGLAFRTINPYYGAKTLAVYSEAEPDVEFSVEGHVLRVVDLTWDMGGRGFSSFLERQYDLLAPAADGKLIRLKQAPGGPRRSAGEIVEWFHNRVAHGANPEDLVLGLRDEGLLNAPDVLAALDWLAAEKMLDGALSEAVSAVRMELIAYQAAEDIPTDDDCA